jgi:DNA polymerase elongation subunit (family B)
VLDPDLGTIRAIGYALVDGLKVPEIEVLMDEEPLMLRKFWVLNAGAGYQVGYNIIDFDYPFIMRRSMALGILTAYPPMLARYQTSPVRDLYGILYNWSKGKSLKWVAKRWGLKAGEHWFTQTGADVDAMHDDEMAEYLKTDVHVTWQLHERMKGVYF